MSSKVAFLFPGQGAQYVGMGKDLYSFVPNAKKTFDAADQILGFSISKICFEGPEDVLTDTANAQIAIFVTSIAVLKAVHSHLPNLTPQAVCGLSLGEFSALVACNSLTFEDGVRLVRKRGELMNAASTQNPGTMASILGLSIENCELICKESGAQVANINSPEQIVISGTQDAIARGCRLAQAKGGKAMPLKVSGAFHSRLMEPAQSGLSEALAKIQLKEPKTTFIPNVTGVPAQKSSEIQVFLGKQITQSVQWVKTIHSLAQMGIAAAFEIGPGKVLKGLTKRNGAYFPVTCIETKKDIEQMVKMTEEKVC